MAAKERTSTDWPDGWAWPFLWILLVPLATGVWQASLLDRVIDSHKCALLFQSLSARWGCAVEDVLPTLVPGLLNLGAFLWLLSTRVRTRSAALIAGALGALRLVGPGLVYIVSGPNLVVEVRFLGPTGVAGAAANSYWASGILWLLSLVVALVFPWLADARKGWRLLVMSCAVGVLVLASVVVAITRASGGEEARYHQDRGRVLNGQGNWEEAVVEFGKAIELNPKLPYAYFGRALAHGTLGKYEEAIDDYGKYMETPPRMEAGARYSRGFLYSLTGKYDQAVADFDKAIQLDLEDYELHNVPGYGPVPYEKLVRDYIQRGIAYARLGRYDQAIADFDKVIELAATYRGSRTKDDQKVEAHYNRAVVYAIRGENVRAIADYNRVIGLSHEKWKGYFKQGFLYPRRVRGNDEVDFDKTFRLDATVLRAYVNRAMAYGELGETERAIADLEKAFSLTDEPTVRTELQRRIEELRNR